MRSNLETHQMASGVQDCQLINERRRNRLTSEPAELWLLICATRELHLAHSAHSDG